MKTTEFIRRTALILFALLLLCSSAFAQTPDLSDMSFDELISLKDSINLAIWNCAEWEEVTVPQGVWQIGVDIPAGHWSLKAADGVHSYVKYGSFLDESGVSISYDSKDYIYKNIYSTTYSQYNANEHRSEIDIAMKDGAYIVIDSGSVVFSPYSGKQSLGFKGLKKSAEKAESTPVIESVYITPEPTAVPSPTPVPTAEPTPVIEYVYITPEPTAVPSPTPVPTAEPTPVIEYVYITPEPTAVPSPTPVPTAEPTPVIEYVYITPEPTAVPSPTPVPTAEPTPVIEYVYITPEPTPLTAQISSEYVNYTSMTVDELLLLQESINGQIEELKRQYAIENGNRIITLDQESLLLFPRQTKTLKPTVERVVDDAPEKTAFTWSSSDTTVATVSTTGVVTAVAVGEATITCAAADDQYILTSIPVSVVNRVSTIVPSDTALTLHLTAHNPAAAQHQLTAVIEPADAYHQTVTWSSSFTDVATVDEDGNIQALKPGTATITITSTEPAANQQPAKKAYCKLTVVQDVEEVTLSETELRLKKGSVATLKATLSPTTAKNRAVTWASSDPTIATVATTGQITAKACGTCTITCTTKDGSEIVAACEVTVYQPVSMLKPEKTSISAFIESKPTAINMTISPEDATDKTLLWTSSDESIAKVDNQGHVTAVSGGNCKITCTAADGSGKTVDIYVLVPSISVEKTDYIVTSKKGLTIPLKYFGQDISKLRLSILNSSFLTAELQKGASPSIKITPERAGKTTITLNDSNNENNAVKLNIEVSSSAVYDAVSYPKAPYDQIMRYPEDHKGNTYQLYGKVLQKLSSGSYTMLRVGTSGGFYDSVFYITYFSDNIDARVIEDDYVTVYGTCTGTHTYETVMGNDITIPAITAEKIKIGRK